MISPVAYPEFLQQPTDLSVVAELMRRKLVEIINQLNSQVQGVGPALASATTITPSYAVHHVTGTAAIDTINAPLGFSGPLFLIPDGIWTMTTAGNIASVVTAVVSKLLIVVYDPIQAKWYPGY